MEASRRFLSNAITCLMCVVSGVPPVRGLPPTHSELESRIAHFSIGIGTPYGYR